MREALPRLTEMILIALGMLLAIAFAASPSPVKDKAAKSLDGYDGITVKAFTVNSYGAAADAPVGLEAELQNRLVQDLLRAKLFEHVVDASSGTPIELPDIRNGEVVNRPGFDPTEGHGLILDGAVTSFSKGNRAARLAVGYGAGEGKLEVQFTLRDEQSGRQLDQFTVKGTFQGGVLGGSENEAVSQMSDTVGHKLVEEIRKNRSK